MLGAMPTLRASLLTVAAVLAGGCTLGTGRAEREAAWARVLVDEIPPGTTRAAATSVLEARGLVVQYRPYAELGERPDECPAARLYAVDRGRVRGLAARFDVRLILCLDDEERVSRRYVDRFNSVI
jgi:hypothetical protein